MEIIIKDTATAKAKAEELLAINNEIKACQASLEEIKAELDSMWGAMQVDRNTYEKMLDKCIENTGEISGCNNDFAEAITDYVTSMESTSSNTSV